MFKGLIYLHFCLLFSAMHVYATHDVVSGRVIDAQTRDPLAFVNLVIHDSRSGGMTDIDGFFRLTHHQPIRSVQLSYVGYETKTYRPDPGKDHHVVALHRKPVELAEVVVMPGENPAHRIVENAIRHRDVNNPENLSAFSYNSYNKFVFTGEMDAPGDGHGTSGNDTIADRISKYLAQRHFFLMETVTERRFRYPGHSNETILASRISGVQHPLFALFMSQMQSFSFYDDYIEIVGERYLSPLAPRSTRRYFFLLEDSTYTGNDTVFVISYRPLKGRIFEGMKGVMYINSNGWALQSVIAEPAYAEEGARVRIQQNYELIEGRQWFPTQLNTDFELADIPDLMGFKILGTGRTYLQDIKIEPPLTRRDFSPFHVEFSPETIVEDDAFWDDFRRDTLTFRELNTYHYLDSVAEEINLDRRIERLETLFGGYWRIGVFDADISRLLRYNKHEGLRPGFSLQTNDRLSRIIRFNSFAGYGFGDGTLKYGGGASFLVDRLSDMRVGYDYQYDVEERGGADFLASPQGPLSTQNLRGFFLETMDLAETHSAWLQFRTFRNYLTVRTYVNVEEVSFLDNYRYASDTDDYRMLDGQTRFFETGAQFRLAYGERFIISPRQIFALWGDYPVMQLNVARGMERFLDGEYDYWRLEAKVQKQFTIPMLGRQRWVLRAGYFSGEAPWNKRFNAPATYRKFSVTTTDAFATMRMDEFVSDRYVALFWYHHFENLLYRGEKFNPQFVLLANIAFGDMRDRDKHHNAGFNTMEKGYFESGFAILDLLGSGFSSLGLEFAYRYGPNAFPAFKDNYTLRLSYTFLF